MLTIRVDEDGRHVAEGRVDADGTMLRIRLWEADKLTTDILVPGTVKAPWWPTVQKVLNARPTGSAPEARPKFYCERGHRIPKLPTLGEKLVCPTCDADEQWAMERRTEKTPMQDLPARFRI